MTAHAEIAASAGGYLRRDGWNKGALTQNRDDPLSPYTHGSHCLGGAVNLALSDGRSDLWDPNADWHRLQHLPDAFPDAGDRGFYEHLRRTMIAVYPDVAPWSADARAAIAEFNNNPDVTRDMVMNILRQIVLRG
jgi:hypothetical protein